MPYGPLVKWSRRRPLTPQSGVRLSYGSPYAYLAQSVEHAAVNRRVVGSSPTVGAKASADSGGFCFAVIFCFLYSENSRSRRIIAPGGSKSATAASLRRPRRKNLGIGKDCLLRLLLPIGAFLLLGENIFSFVEIHYVYNKHQHACNKA